MNSGGFVTQEEIDKTNLGNRVSPSVLMVREMKALKDCWTTEEISTHLGVHAETVKRWAKAKDNFGRKKVSAPTLIYKLGGIYVKAYTKEDVLEMEDFARSKGHEFTPIDPTKTLEEQTPLPGFYFDPKKGKNR